MTPSRTLRVLVAGGGIAGLEALLALHDLAGDRVDITLLSPSDAFVYRPLSVAEPFGLGHAERIPLDQIARDTGSRRVQGTLASVDDAAGMVRTSEGDELEFDALLVAVGAVAVEAMQGVTTWWPGGDPEVPGGLLRDLEEGYLKSVAFVVPSGFAWPLPTYELALMTAREVAGMGQADVAVSVVTPEPEPLALFGSAASAAVREELDRAGVRLVTGTPVDLRRTSDGIAIVRPDGTATMTARRAIAVPRLLGPAIDGLRGDEEGFIVTADDGRVDGLQRTWAAGDGVRSPVKLGGLATWQAGRAAAAIARVAGADAAGPGEDEPVLEGVLMTGAAPRPLDGAPQPRLLYEPLWRPAGKVAGRWLPGYIGDERRAPDAENAAVVPIRLRASDVRAVDARALFDLSRPVHPNDPGLQRLGALMHRTHKP